MSRFSQLAGVEDGGRIDCIMAILSLVSAMANVTEEQGGIQSESALGLVGSALIKLGVTEDEIEETVELLPFLQLAIAIGELNSA